MWRFLSTVEKREGFETLGFLEGDPYSIDDLGAVGASLQQAVTLQDAIETFCRLLPTIADDNKAKLIRGNELSWLIIGCERFDNTAPAADHYTVLPLREIIRLAAGPEWRPDKISFLTGPNPALDSFTETGDIELLFDQDTVGVAFDTRLLSKFVLPFSGVTTSSSQVEASQILERTASESLYQLLLSIGSYGRFPKAEEAAHVLGTSRATLYRRLSDEGVSYHRIVERVRFTLAQQLLRDPANKIVDIAHALGYSEASNFIRAFQRLSGVTPRAFRDIKQEPS